MYYGQYPWEIYTQATSTNGYNHQSMFNFEHIMISLDFTEQGLQYPHGNWLELLFLNV